MTEFVIPIIRIRGNLLVPLQGELTDAQAGWLREQILNHIHKTETMGLVIDVSGVAVLDSHLCSLLAGITAASRLMGVDSILCGLSPEVVMTLQAMGIDLVDVETAPGLEDALERLGVFSPPTTDAMRFYDDSRARELDDDC